jgi:hypothetical protein
MCPLRTKWEHHSRETATFFSRESGEELKKGHLSGRSCDPSRSKIAFPQTGRKRRSVAINLPFPRRMRIGLRHYERIVFFTHVRKSGWARASIVQLGRGGQRLSPPLREKPLLQCRADLEFLDRAFDCGLLVGGFNLSKQDRRRSFDVVDIPLVRLACGRVWLFSWALHWFAFSSQFGRTSAPMVPHFVHTIFGPSEGTGTSPGRRSTFMITPFDDPQPCVNRLTHAARKVAHVSCRWICR